MERVGRTQGDDSDVGAGGFPDGPTRFGGEAGRVSDSQGVWHPFTHRQADGLSDGPTKSDAAKADQAGVESARRVEAHYCGPDEGMLVELDKTSGSSTSTNMPVSSTRTVPTCCVSSQLAMAVTSSGGQSTSPSSIPSIDRSTSSASGDGRNRAIVSNRHPCSRVAV